MLPTEAVAIAVDVHVPPVTLSDRLTVSPAHTVGIPEIIPASGDGLTVIVRLAVAAPQELITIYSTVSTPGAMPEITPPDTVAFPFIVLHRPPAAVSDTIIVAPVQTVDIPDIIPAIGKGLTVTGCDAIAVPHEFVTVYLIVSRPAATPVTTPPETVAWELLDHTPPVAASVKSISDPTHTVVTPPTVPASGSGLIVTTAVAVAVWVPLVTV